MPISRNNLFQTSYLLFQRGIVVKWLETLIYGAENRQVVVSSNPTLPSDVWKTLSVNPAVIGYPFRIRKGQGCERRWMGSALHQLCQDTVRLLPKLPLWLIAIGNFTFTHWHALETEERKDLGVTLSSQLNCDRPINNVVSKGNRTLDFLRT